MRRTKPEHVTFARNLRRLLRLLTLSTAWLPTPTRAKVGSILINSGNRLVRHGSLRVRLGVLLVTVRRREP